MTDINKFEACDSVEPHHCIMIAADPHADRVIVVYSGPLPGVTQDAMDAADLTLVHPGTLAALKAKLDHMGVGTPVLETPATEQPAAVDTYTDEGRAVWQEKMLDMISP